MIPLKKPTEDLKDEPTRLHVNHILQEAMGNPIVLGSAPTASAPLLDDQSWGQYSNDIFFRIGGNIYKFTADEVITIT